MWCKALTSILRPSKQEWASFSVFTKWLIATRAAVLIITFLPSCMVGLLAYRAGSFDLRVWLLMTTGLMLAHATNNLLNDIVDYTKGVDKGDYFRNQYGVHPMEMMSRSELAAHLLGTGLSALAIGVYLTILKGPITLCVTLFGAFFLLFYTYPLKYIGLGEVSVFLVWGVLMVGGGFHVITNTWSWEVVYIVMPLSLGITAIIFGKHIDKLKADKAKGIYTLPVIMGDKVSRLVAIQLMALQYIIVVGGVLSRVYSPLLLSVLGALPSLVQAIHVFLRPAPASCPADYPKNTWPLWFVAHTFKHNSVFGLLFVVGFVLDTLFVSKVW